MAQQQSSRLNRLLTLLDTGSTQATRFAAARQIGDIARLHPQDLTSLLKKVAHYLRSKSWDTRVAAAHAIGAIAQNVKHTSLTELFSTVQTKMSEGGMEMAGVFEDVLAWPAYNSKVLSSVSSRRIDLDKVLEFGALLASGGQEYDVAADSSKNPRDRLARQKQNLRRRLGLDVCEQFMDVNDMIKDEDLIAQKLPPRGNGLDHRIYTSASIHSIQRLVANMVPSAKRPSARQLNLLKRKAKINSKDQMKLWVEDGETEMQYAHNSTTAKGVAPDSPNLAKVDFSYDDDNSDSDGDGLWPFRSYVEQLMLDMFDPVWEVRHGSIMAVREILTHHGASAGVYMPDMSSLAQHVEIRDKTSIFSIEEDSSATVKREASVFSMEEDLSATFKREASVFSTEEDSSVTVRREGEIDLNMSVTADESEPERKRPKLEGSCPPSENINFAIKNENCDLDIDNEDGSSDLHVRQVDQQTNLFKVDGETFVNSMSDASKEGLGPSFGGGPGAEESNPWSGKKLSSGNPSIQENLPNGSELMVWVKLARHSWLRNCEFLQDCAIRFLCVLSLDRFGDYVSDQVVAPVRETCAQALGASFKYMHPSLVHDTLNILLQMQHRPEWEIRHGSLLGIKYLVAVRQDMLPDLLGNIIPACKAGLEDPDDDVRAVAAEALIPAAAAIVVMNNVHTLHDIIMLLWDILLDLDDLSPSTSSVMNLLAEIYSQEAMIPRLDGTGSVEEKPEFDLNDMVNTDNIQERNELQESPYMLSTLAPRLWPFMRHSITTVRHSAIRTLERLLDAGLRRSISESSSCSFWPSFILGDTIRIVFQNLLLESNEQILESSQRVWNILVQCPVEDLEAVAKPYMSSWLELITTPYGAQLDTSKMFWPAAPPRKSQLRAAAKVRAVKFENNHQRNNCSNSAGGIAALEKTGDLSAQSLKIVFGADMEMSVTHTRVVTASALGVLVSKMRKESMQCLLDPLWNALTSSSGVQRQVASMIIISWFKEIKDRTSCGSNLTKPIVPDHMRKMLLDLLACMDPAFPTKDSHVPYSELLRTYSKMRNEATLLLSAVESSGKFSNMLSTIKIGLERLTADDAINFASKLPPLTNDNSGTEATEKLVIDDLESAKQRLLTTSSYLKCVQSNLHVAVSSLVAAAIVWMSELPAKLNPVILPLMASIKREQEEILQQKAAEALAEIIFHCIPRKPGPNDKLIKNICTLTCMDPKETPQSGVINSMEIIDDQDLLSFGSTTSKLKSKVHLLSAGEERSRIEGLITRRGAELALRHLCDKFGASLFDMLPKLWDCLSEVVKPAGAADDERVSQAVDGVRDPQSLINNIQVVRSISPMLHEKLKPRLLTLLPCIFRCIRHPHVAVRLSASRCITTMAKSMTFDVMRSIMENAIPMLGDMTSTFSRQGAGMLISLLVQGLGVDLVPYAPLLVVPLLRCMSDCDTSVRQSVTHSFAALVPLLPLARGLPPPVGVSEELSGNKEDARFLEQLLDNSHIDDYKLCTELKVSLRRYQQEGINWLGFLKRFKLHGILCDDMGLGKTLQASAIVASDIAEHRAVRNSNDLPPTLIICPSTLVGHWAFEIEKYIDASIVSTLQYVGSAQDRVGLREHFNKHNIVITSYDVVRKDVDYLGQCIWNYCILDEGHIIKNTKSKITVAVKQLKANHRLILSGTPIQNNIMDLWSLFDFLMPGFLGTERKFQATYGKPLVAARDPKCSGKDAEAGILAMEALHKQVMPFLLRRTKDEVLSDLPEKIIQDRYCDLSPVQLRLYEKFSGSHVKQEISSMVKLNESEGAKEAANCASSKTSSHVFQALQYLLKLCSHPLLVIGERVPPALEGHLSELFPGSSDIISELHNLIHSPKLVALQEILEECGIGLDNSYSESSLSVGQHRVLIFAQHKALLDIIERDLFQTHMKSVTYLRLDGSVEPEKHFDIVKAFNSDPTIDVLLLTTHVGGLGLNLTSADTLVFMEHDWNPMRDHQAMDRAHRLGQRKVVNVHRLIMRGTLEEKVMSLQKFKLSIANAVINADNASLKSMNTDQLLDLFGSAETSKKGAPVSRRSDGKFDGDPKLAGTGTGKGLKAILGGLEELWDQSQYAEEYNLSQFLAKLNG